PQYPLYHLYHTLVCSACGSMLWPSRHSLPCAASPAEGPVTVTPRVGPSRQLGSALNPNTDFGVLEFRVRVWWYSQQLEYRGGRAQEVEATCGRTRMWGIQWRGLNAGQTSGTEYNTGYRPCNIDLLTE